MTKPPDLPRHGRLFVGLMSGTSVDGIDCALVSASGNTVQLLATHAEPVDPALRERIADISLPGADEIERAGSLDRELGALFARGTLELLRQAGVEPAQITAIGSHGQTIRHRPPSDSARQGQPFTLQIGDPATIAELTGITTVADFRRRDIAAGGEGAPLAPAFHRHAFGRAGCNRAIVNIGGIANVSLLEGEELVAGFDTGPGNTLMDLWVRENRNAPYDRNGEWAANGEVSSQLLGRFLEHPYFAKTGPRSTGKEAFNRQWLDSVLAAAPDMDAQTIQATLAELTAATIASGIRGGGVEVDEVYVCGGGAHNAWLLQRIGVNLGDAVRVSSTAALGLAPDWVEAATFAWLAQRTLDELPGNEPRVTGAGGERVLGAVYLASQRAGRPQK